MLFVVAATAGGTYLLSTSTTRPHAQPLPRHEFGPGTRDEHPKPTHRRRIAPPPVPANHLSLPANHLSIPALGVSAPIDRGALEQHLLVLPTDVHRVAQWIGGAGPTDRHGTVLIAGHVDNSRQGKGALWPLSTAEPDDDVIVTAPSGRPTRWRVIGLRAVVKARLPQTIFDKSGSRRLVIVTCGGSLIHSPAGNYYEDNVVLTAVPA